MAEDIEVREVLNFILGGHSEFTIKNIRSGNGFKYKVSRSKKKDTLYYVRVANGNSYEYAGCLFTDNGIRYFKGKNGTLEVDSDPIKGLMWSIRKGNHSLPRPMVMYHHGKCACCGKSLNDVVSIERGFGPVCWDRLQAASKEV